MLRPKINKVEPEEPLTYGKIHFYDKKISGNFTRSKELEKQLYRIYKKVKIIFNSN